MATFAPSISRKLFAGLQALKVNNSGITNFVDYLSITALASDDQDGATANQLQQLLQISEPGAEMPGLLAAAAQGHRWAAPHCPHLAEQLQAARNADEAAAVAASSASAPTAFALGGAGGHSGSKQSDYISSPAGTMSRAHFFQNLCPFLVDRALEFPALFPSGALPFAAAPKREDMLRSRQVRLEQRLVLTRRQILCTHALAFLGAEPSVTRKDVGRTGSMNWKRLQMSRMSRIGIERLLCQLNYFEYWRTHWPTENNAVSAARDDDSKSSAAEAASTAAAPASLPGPKIDEKVVYTRISLANFPVPTDSDPSGDNSCGAFPDWESSTLPVVSLPSEHPSSEVRMSVQDSVKRYGEEIASTGCDIEAHFIEEFRGTRSIVDFANEQCGFTCLIPSTTQEEVLCSTNPDLMLTMVMFDKMLDTHVFESITVSNAFYMSAYKGYRDTFTFVGPSPKLSWPTNPTSAPCIIAIDNSVNVGYQFTSALVTRDMCKTFAGYSAPDAESVIATGPLGCGAFACDIVRAFLQQLCVLAHAGKYCCYYERNPPQFRIMRDLLRLKRVLVKDVFAWMVEFGRSANARVTQQSSDAPPPLGSQAMTRHSQPMQKLTGKLIKKTCGEDDDGSSSAPAAAADEGNGDNNNNNKAVQQQIERLEKMAAQLLSSGALMERSFGIFVLQKLVNFGKTQ